MERVAPQVPGKLPVKRKRSFAKLFVRWEYLVMILPGLIVLLINNYIPMLGIAMAFQKHNYIQKPETPDLFSWLPQYFYNIIENFRRGNFPLLSYLDANGDVVSIKSAFGNFSFLLKRGAFEAARNTLLYNLVFIVLGLVVAVTFAIMLSELRNKRTAKVYQSVMFLPYFLSWVVVGYLAYAFLSNENGFINRSILESFGMQQQFYSRPEYWPFILVFFNLWKYTGYNCVVYLAAITGIDPEYYEAATIDGANRLQRIRHITLPQLQPLMIILTVLAIGRIFNADFGLFYFVPKMQGPLIPVTQVVDTYVYRAMTQLHDFGMAAAAGLLQSIVGFICVFSANWIVRKLDRDKAVF